MPIPTSSRIPQRGPRKATASGSSSLPRSTSFLQPRGSITAATAASNSTAAGSNVLPPHPPSRLQSPGGASSSDALPPSQQQARFARSHSTPLIAPPVRSNQFAAVHNDRPQLTIEVPSHGLPSGDAFASSSSTSTSLVPPSPSTHHDNIRVVLRIRPPNAANDRPAAALQPLSRRCLEVAPDAKGVTLAPSTLQEKRFGFDRVFAETSAQDQIFLDVGVTAVANTLNGFNGCIFAYGQTGSGKTFTMLGDTSTADANALGASPLRGLIPRIFDHLVARLADRNSATATLACSYLEIYNEKVFDLLEDGAAMQQPKSLREDAAKGVYVEQLREVPIATEAEALAWLQLGSSNRRMASTDMNRESSRSHAVFTIKLVQTERTAAGVQVTRRSNLHLVDLAGSEKQSQTKAAGQRLKEAAQINKSLSALGNVIMALVEQSAGKHRHVHYRDSKLTYLLKDSLGGNAITTIIATISGEEKFFAETLSTLKFAQRAKFIKNKAVQNQDADSVLPLLKLELERLRAEIVQLRASGHGTSTSTAPAESPSTGSPSGLKSSPSSYYQQQLAQLQQLQLQQQTQQHEPKTNRWEPALDVMDKLLRASGAAAPCDLAPHEVGNPVDVRCARLEMLLYRMICRYEEHKEFAFAPERSRHAFRRPVVLLKSGLRAPKRYGVTAPSTENQQPPPDGRFLSTSEEKVLVDELTRGRELERENNLMRQELCELLEWKALVEDERRNGNADADGYSAAAAPDAARASDEAVELLNVYRALVDDLAELLRDKRPALSSPPSPGSGSSFTEDNSVSYASGGEDDDRDDVSVTASGHDLTDGDVSEDGDVSATYREIQRAHALSDRVERKLDQYQDALQRLEKELLATQDELETSSAATKFAEFQLQQVRALAADESDARQQELDATVAALQHELATAHNRVAALEQQQVAAVECSASELEQLRSALTASQQDNGELEQLRAVVATAEREVGDRDRLLASTNMQLEAIARELAQLRGSLAAAQQDAAAKASTAETANAQLLACRTELEALRVSTAAAQSDVDAKDRALQDANAQLRDTKSALESLRFELHSAQQVVGSKAHVLDEANNQLHAHRLEVETLRLTLANAQSELESKSRALDDARALADTHQHELDELRVALSTARRTASDKSRALDDARFRLESLEIERDDLAQRAQHERAQLEAQFAKRMRGYEARELAHEDELQQLRAATPPRRNSSKSSEQENAGMELALLAAQNIIQQLESELAAVRAQSGNAPSEPAISVASGGSDRIDSNGEDASASAGHPQTSMMTTIAATSSSSRTNSVEEATAVVETAATNEVKLEHVALHSIVALGERHPASPSSMRAIARQNDEIKRLAAERVALNSRLQMTQQKMKRLEDELTRSRNSHLTTRGIATEFFCEM